MTNYLTKITTTEATQTNNSLLEGINKKKFKNYMKILKFLMQNLTSSILCYLVTKN